jgi:nucleotide-binding universal stress UspA family protein
MMAHMRAVIWIVEGTWQGCVDVAAGILPSDAEVVLLHAEPADAKLAAEAASAGLLGRHRPGRGEPGLAQIADEEAQRLLGAAEQRLGRGELRRLRVRGRVERAVVDALADGVDVLVCARDGDRSRLGPHSLGPATRFVVDHTPCTVVLVWPDETPGVASIPPPPRHGPPHHHGPLHPPPHER